MSEQGNDISTKNLESKSMLEKYREVGFLQDAYESDYFADFIAYPNRVFRLSLPKSVDGNNLPTNWIHLKLYRLTTEKMMLHQIMFLSIFEVQKLVYNLPGIMRFAEESFRRNPNNISQEGNAVVDYGFLKPEQDAEYCDQYWDVLETARRKLRVSTVWYEKQDFSRTYFQIKLFTRKSVDAEFVKKGCVTIRVGEMQKMIDHSDAMIEQMARESFRRTSTSMLNNKKE